MDKFSSICYIAYSAVKYLSREISHENFDLNAFQTFFLWKQLHTQEGEQTLGNCFGDKNTQKISVYSVLSTWIFFHERILRSEHKAKTWDQLWALPSDHR
jgi:hypothetical protein